MSVFPILIYDTPFIGVQMIFFLTSETDSVVNHGIEKQIGKSQGSSCANPSPGGDGWQVPRDSREGEGESITG